VLRCSQDHAKLECTILTTLYFAGAKNTDSWHTRKGDFQCAFPLDILMVPSFALTVSADGERLTCGGFSLGKTVHLGSFEFIIDYFSNLSLFAWRNDLGITFMGSTQGGPPSPWWDMIEDSTEEFHTASSGEGALTSPLLGGTTRGLHWLPSQAHHG
jgi:hypothetical protein